MEEQPGYASSREASLVAVVCVVFSVFLKETIKLIEE